MPILLLSGPIAVGKSSAAAELVQRFAYLRLRTGSFLQCLAQAQGRRISREDLQEVGDRLDLQTDYRWVIDDIAVPAMTQKPTATHWLLDAVRKERQVEHFRGHFRVVFHAHLVAPEAVLKSRYENRRATLPDPELEPLYEEAIQHPSEVASRELARIADLLVDLTTNSPHEAAAAIAHAAERGGPSA